MPGNQICRILTSDQIKKGEKRDESLQSLEKLSRKLGMPHRTIMAGNSLVEIRDAVTKALLTGCRVVVVTGGTGPAGRDKSIEAVKPLAEKELTGIGEYHRLLSYNRGVKNAWLSRTTAFVTGEKLVLVIPGNPDALNLLADEMADLVKHVLEQLEKGRH